MARDLSIGTCAHCQQQFAYRLVHCGFGDSVYAYCDTCGRTALLSTWDKRMPNLPDCPGQQEMCSAMESYVEPCQCGGAFKKGCSPRCWRCKQPLSAEDATSFIESNAPGTQKGWRWQRTWSGTYCIIIEDKIIKNNFR